MYDMLRLGAVLRKLSQTRCLTLSTPSHQTGRNLSRLQFKKWTREQFQCDFWKLSLQHSRVPGGSQSTARAPCSHHEHIQPAPLLPCPPGLRAAFGGERWQSPGERQERHRGRLCRAPSTGTASQEPQTLTFLWSRRQEECYSNPSVRAQTRNQYLPCSSTK